MHYGVPDLGIIGLRGVADATSRLREAVDLPIIVDGDTGFGNAVNVSAHRARAGTRRRGRHPARKNQLFPKRCGHFSGKEVAPLPEMLSKIRAAADARRDPDFLIIARTDSRAVLGFDGRGRTRAGLRRRGRGHPVRRDHGKSEEVRAFA